MGVLHDSLDAFTGGQSLEDMLHGSYLAQHMCNGALKEVGKMGEEGQRLKEKQKPLPKPHQHPLLQLFTSEEFFIFDSF